MSLAGEVAAHDASAEGEGAGEEGAHQAAQGNEIDDAQGLGRGHDGMQGESCR